VAQSPVNAFHFGLIPSLNLYLMTSSPHIHSVILLIRSLEMQDLMHSINTQDSIFHDGDPTTGKLGTIVTALWLNNVQAATRDVQAEIKNVLAKAGMTPDPKKTNQLA